MKKFLTIIISIILIILLSFLITLLTVKNILKKENINAILNNVEIEETILKNDNFKDLIDELLEPIYKETRKYNISDEIVIKILDTKEVKNIMSIISSNIIDFTLTGKNQKIINMEDINSLINKSIDELNKSEYITITEENKNNILNIALKEVDKYQKYIPDMKKLEENLNNSNIKILKYIRIIFSNNFLLWLCLLITFLALSIVLLNLKNFRFLKYLSFAILFSSIIILILNIFIKIFLKNNCAYIIDILGKNINFVIPIISIFVSLILFIIYFIINKKHTLNSLMNTQ